MVVGSPCWCRRRRRRIEDVVDEVVELGPPSSASFRLVLFGGGTESPEELTNPFEDPSRESESDLCELLTGAEVEIVSFLYLTVHPAPVPYVCASLANN